AGLWLSSRARVDCDVAFAGLLPRRIFYSVRSDRKAIWHANAGCRGFHFPDNARSGRGGKSISHRLVGSVVLGTSEKLAVVIVIALTILYTFEGGMKAVIWTDVVQLLLYLTGSVVTLGFLIHVIPGGWNEATHVAATAGNKLQFLDFSFSLATKY